MLQKTQIKHKLKKAVLIGTALFMAAGADNGWAVGNLAKTVTVHAKSIVKANGEPTKKALNVLTYDNKIQSECNEHYIVEIKRGEDFPSGYDAYVKEMEQTDVDDYTKKLNKFLQNSNSEVADVAHPVNLGVTDETGEDAKDIGKTTVRMYMEEDTDQLNGFDLYHFKDKDEPEKINYKTGKGEEKNELKSYIEFKTDSFSPFLFVKTKSVEKTEQSGNETNDFSDTIADESNIETTAEAPSMLDIHFKTLSAQLFKGADKGDDGIYRWNVASYDLSQHRFNFRINYALSGSDRAKEGSVRMRIPKNILQSRDGLNANSYELSIPSQSDVERYQSGQGDAIAADAKFAYYEDGDSTPYSAMSSYGQPGMFQGCNNLKTLHIGKMDLSSAKNFSRMFSGCSSLETIDGTFVNGNVVEDLNTMFTGCRQLQTIDISGLNVANAKNTQFMFYDCSLLETIISNNFETISITNDQEMFAQCPNLPNFDTAQTGSSMAVSQEEGGYLTKPKQKSSVVSDAVQKLASLLS